MDLGWRLCPAGHLLEGQSISHLNSVGWTASGLLSALCHLELESEQSVIWRTGNTGLRSDTLSYSAADGASVNSVRGLRVLLTDPKHLFLATVVTGAWFSFQL